MYGPDQPSLTLGLRGIVYTEVEVLGPTQDVHSGLFGGIVHNPNQLLVNALADLIDADGHITVPGFYEGVQPLSAREKSLYAALAVDEEAYCRTLGVPSLVGEREYSLLERRWTRPTLDINLLPRRQSAHRHTGGSPSGRLLPTSARPKPRTHPSCPRRAHPRSSARRHPRRIQKPALLTGLLFGSRPSTSRACARGDAQGIRNRAGVYPRGRLHPHRRRFCRCDGRTGPAHRPRANHRQLARP